MKKFAVFALIAVFGVGACLPVAPAPNTPAPTVDILGTANANGLTAQAQTLAAQPTPTAVPPTETFTPPPMDTAVIVNTDTPLPNLTTTPATATSGGPADVVFPSNTPTLAVAGSFTPSPTNAIMTYGTLPPANRPYIDATLLNKSRTEAYISLQVVTDQGYTIIEYPVEKVVKILIPVGNYTYVAWVGGRQFVGYFHAGKDNSVTITMFKDKIVIN